MTKEVKIPTEHPRAKSLKHRERLVEFFDKGVVAQAGLIAHGRGEAFDYLLGEKTANFAIRALKAAAATLLMSEYPVISVNGNTAALVATDIARLARITEAKIEVNLFYRSTKREQAIEKVLREAGATKVLGVGEDASAEIDEIGSERRRVDPKGILIADVVLVPLEDGDRSEALVNMGKKVIAIDLNPLSRTAQLATITIVDNIVRVMPALAKIVDKQRVEGKEKLEEITSSFDNGKTLSDAISLISRRLSTLAKSGTHLSFVEMNNR